MLEGQIRVVLRQARTVCFGAAVGTATRSTAGRRAAPTTTRRAGTTTWGSVPFCPQVSEFKSRNRAEQAWRSEGRATTACGAGVRVAGVWAQVKREPAQRSRFVVERDRRADIPVGIRACEARADRGRQLRRSAMCIATAPR